MHVTNEVKDAEVTGHHRSVGTEREERARVGAQRPPPVMRPHSRHSAIRYGAGSWSCSRTAS